MSDVDIHLEIRNNAKQLEKVVEILEAKGNSNLAKAKDSNGNLPLHDAMRVGEKGVFDLVQALVDMNPEGVRTKNMFGDLPIHYLVGPDTGDGNKALKFLLKEYPQGSKIQNKEGVLPIHYAANEGCGVMAKLLLKEYPEGIKVKDNEGSLPIHDACSNGHSTIRLLVDAYPEGLQHKDINGNLPIHRALHGELADVGEYDFLIESYPDCLKVESDDEQLPLHLAASIGSIEVAELICKKHPIATKKLDQFGKSPLDLAVERKYHPMIKMLARICPDASDMKHNCHDPIMKLLEESKFPKYRRELVSVLLRCSKNQKKKSNSMNTDQIAELESKLETMKAGKEHAQIGLNDEKKRVAALIMEHSKKYEEQNKLQEASNKRSEEKLRQEKQHVVSLKKQVEHAKEQVEHAEKIVRNSKIALKEENKRAAALTADNKKYEEQREQDKQQIASLKEQLEQEKQQIVSLKEGVEHSEKRIQSFELARKSESKLLSRILPISDNWAVADLKSIAKSLKTRLDALKTQFQVGGQPSTAQQLAQICLRCLIEKSDPSKEDLLLTIKTIDSELSEVESTVASLSTSDAIVIPEATRSLSESPENAPRKRARVSISPA